LKIFSFEVSRNFRSFSTFSQLGYYFRNETIIKTRFKKKQEVRKGKKNVEKEFFLNTQIFKNQTDKKRMKEKKQRLKIHVLIKQEKINSYFKIDGVKTSGSLEE
jgi:hypothetical protein